MDAADFRRIALSLDGAEESSHMGAPDFRVGGAIFATLAHQDKGYGNLLLSPQTQRILVATQPDLFLPVAGGWGRNGFTHIRLAQADDQSMAEAVRLAWTRRVEKNAARKKRKPAQPK